MGLKLALKIANVGPCYMHHITKTSLPVKLDNHTFLYYKSVKQIKTTVSSVMTL